MAKPRGNRATNDACDLGGPPQLATVADLTGGITPQTGRDHMRRRSSAVMPGRINLKAVAEALADEGLDPAVEIPRVLKAQRPVLDRSGQLVLDENGKPRMESVVDADTKLRTYTELLGYLQPKLKAVEVKMSGSLELSEEQLNQRLTALLAKAVKAP